MIRKIRGSSDLEMSSCGFEDVYKLQKFCLIKTEAKDLAYLDAQKSSKLNESENTKLGPII